MTKLATLVSKYKDDFETILRLSSGTISTLVITGTPVLSGSLQASWNPTNGPPAANNVTISAANPHASRSSAARVVNTLQVGDTFSLVNGQPYARRIEYEGWSAKASSGMMRIHVAKWQQIVNQNT